MKYEQHNQFEPHLILPIGTQVTMRIAVKGDLGETLQPSGAVATIVEILPDLVQTYRVRFPSGGESILRRDTFAVRKHLRQAALESLIANSDHDLYNHVIYRCVVGSRAFGLDSNESDTDRRGIYLAPAALQWSLAGAPEQLENDATQETYWEMQKFLSMALKANPNVLECLYTPLVETTTPLIDELLAMRGIFLSRFVYQTYNGYVLSQFKKLEQDLRIKGGPRWKHAMHLIRLLLSGIGIMRDGFVAVRVDGCRDHLLAIKYGEMPWAEVNRWRLSLHRDFDRAFTETTLPEYPDYEKADAFLIKARRSAVS